MRRMETIRHIADRLARYIPLTVIVAALVAVAIVGYNAGTARGAPELTTSPALNTDRDHRAVNKCHHRGAPRRICTALVAGTHTAHVPRRWATDPGTLYIIYRESTDNPAAVNPRPCSAGGHARGLFQLCDDTWHAEHCIRWRQRWHDAAYQARCGFRYIRDRYGNPGHARAYWGRHGFY